ncbi:hypothetical protein [uncultured Desulfobacter sp.]|nr:hypothetical protein [uncultured Desulfobacter sp.]
MNKTKLTDTQYSALEKVEQQYAAWRETRIKYRQANLGLNQRWPVEIE